MDVNLGLLIHLFNFVLLAVAVAMALRMSRASAPAPAGALLSAAFVLMAATPLLDLYGHLQGIGPMLEASDMLAMLSALLMLAGVYLLRGVAAKRQASRQKLHQQLDELQRFQRLAVGRELRMKELVAENAALREHLARAKERGVAS